MNFYPVHEPANAEHEIGILNFKTTYFTLNHMPQQEIINNRGIHDDEVRGKNKEVVGEDIVEEVKLIEFVKNKSTSNLIHKILKSD